MMRWKHAGPLMAVLACMAQPANTPPDNQKIVVAQLAPATIQDRLNSVPRKLADRVAKLESLFHDAGCADDRFFEQPVPHSKAPNLVCTLIGQTDSEIVVGGHLDSVEIGMGAIDDWSGAALLPSLYQSLKDKPRRHRFVFWASRPKNRGLSARPSSCAGCRAKSAAASAP
jgi:hypothetical protein